MLISTRMTEKGMVEACKDMGKSFRWVGNKLGRYDNSIRYDCNNIRRKKEKRGLKKKLSDVTKNLIIRKVINKETSLERIKSEFDLNVSKETIRRVFKN